MKRRTLLQVFSAVLTLVLLLGQAALASDAMGSDVLLADAQLSFGTKLAKGVFWSSAYSDLRQEHYISYTPNKTVLPVVSYGNKITSKSTLTTSARAVEKDGSQVVAGINGDYYVVNTGVPLGIVVTEGALRSSASYLSAIGFLDDGTAFIGTPDLTIRVITGENGQTSFDLDGLNKVRSSEGGVYLFTEDFGATTLNTKSGVDVILALPEGGTDLLKIGSTVTATVERVVEATGATALEHGKIVLSTVGTGGAWHLRTLRNLSAGDKVQIQISSADPHWNDVEYAMGGLYHLLENGKMASSNLPTGSAPRTAIGVKADGSTIFYTIDGRQPGYSIGATMTQVANRLLELGCVDAICLDGGGSTSLGVTMPDDAALSLINSPSDGSQRANSTCFLLVSKTTPSGLLGSFYVKPYDALLLSGASIPISAVPLDTNYHTMTYDGPLTYGIYNGDGVISSDGLFTAGSSASICTVSVSSGNAYGQAKVTVVQTPTEIQLFNASGKAVTSLTVSPNTLTDLTAKATYHNLPLTAQNTCFRWSVSDGIGTVDNRGRLTASGKSGSGTLTVSAGSTKYSIPIKVTGHIASVTSFEAAPSGVAASNTITPSLQNNRDYVKSGTGSLKLSYQKGTDGAARCNANIPISAGDTLLTLWVYGDGSGNAFSLYFSTEAGTASASVTNLTFTGWKRCTVSLPAKATAISGFVVGCSNKSSGTIYVDQITSSNEAITDETPPALSLSISGSSITGQVTDTVNKVLDKNQISLTYDGTNLDFSFDSATGKLTATLPASNNQLHRVTLTASDVSGNFARKSLDAGVNRHNAFFDTASHWCQPYAQFLYDHEISVGVPTAEGYAFQPDKNISRAEFAVMLARFLKLDLDSTPSSVLPFADVRSIPSWALPAVKAIYAKGILNGSVRNGALVFLPNGNISRAEVSTILARTLPRGFVQKALSYQDAASVPAWAKPSMEILSSLGILSGYQNRISPNDPITRGSVAKLLCAIQ